MSDDDGSSIRQRHGAPDSLEEPPVDDQTLSDLLRSEAIWASRPDDLEQRVVDAIGMTGSTSDPGVVAIPRPLRRGNQQLVLATAATLAIAAVGGGVVIIRDPTPTITMALSGTELSPQARGEAQLKDTPSGIEIVLGASGLPPAPVGSYYQGWARGKAGTVSIGTFHLRHGSEGVVLWSGVALRDYPTVSVTKQDEAGGTAPSGRSYLSEPCPTERGDIAGPHEVRSPC